MRRVRGISRVLARARAHVGSVAALALSANVS